MIHPYNGTLLSNKTKQITDTRKNTDKSQKASFGVKEIRNRSYILYNSILDILEKAKL